MSNRMGLALNAADVEPATLNLANDCERSATAISSTRKNLNERYTLRETVRPNGMKLGLLTDIHEHVEHLQTALECFKAEGVDQVVVIGDLFHNGQRVAETCRLLAQANAIGVWGNHDFDLIFDPQPYVRYPPSALSYLASLRPRLEIAGCHFTHIEPWLDPENVADLWHFEGLPDSDEKLARSFHSVPHQFLFIGHYHQWFLATPQGILNWQGECTVDLSQGRYFVVIGALCQGQFAIFNTETKQLLPMAN